MCELFQKSKATISEYIKNAFEEGEVDARATVRNFRTVQMEGNREVELDLILQMNNRELLDHAGKISHKMALEKSDKEFEKYQLVSNNEPMQ